MLNIQGIQIRRHIAQHYLHAVPQINSKDERCSLISLHNSSWVQQYSSTEACGYSIANQFGWSATCLSCLQITWPALGFDPEFHMYDNQPPSTAVIIIKLLNRDLWSKHRHSQHYICWDKKRHSWFMLCTCKLTHHRNCCIISNDTKQSGSVPVSPISLRGVLRPDSTLSYRHKTVLPWLFKDEYEQAYA